MATDRDKPKSRPTHLRLLPEDGAVQAEALADVVGTARTTSGPQTTAGDPSTGQERPVWATEPTPLLILAWHPESDITTYELALAQLVLRRMWQIEDSCALTATFFIRKLAAMWETTPREVRRHFQEVGGNLVGKIKFRDP